MSKWILGNVAGAGLGVVVGLVAANNMLTGPFRVVLWGIVGAVAGMTQQLILLRWFNLKNWMWVSLVGWMTGGLLVERAGVNWGVIGGAVGAMQWLLLRQHVHRAGWWVAANAVGLILGATFGWSIRFTSRWSFFRQSISIDQRFLEGTDWVIAGIAGGVATGVITGLWLMWLLSSPRRKSNELSNPKNEV